MSKCKCCGREINANSGFNAYVQCETCQSYLFIGNENQNASFYGKENNLITNEPDISGSKERIYNIFDNFNDRFIAHQKTKEWWKYRHRLNDLIQGKGKKVLEMGIGRGDFLQALLTKGIDAYGFDISATLVDTFKNKYPQYAGKVFVCSSGNTKRIKSIVGGGG